RAVLVVVELLELIREIAVGRLEILLRQVTRELTHRVRREWRTLLGRFWVARRARQEPTPDLGSERYRGRHKKLSPVQEGLQIRCSPAADPLRPGGQSPMKAWVP